jgi:hypothetical protein
MTYTRNDNDQWWSCAKAIATEDRIEVGAYNALACSEFRLQTELGPMPYFGAVETAPVVLLLAHPSRGGASFSLHDHVFRRSGWALAALHPDAPSGMRGWWHERLTPLIAAFGAQQVSNAVAAVPLTPWASGRFDRDLRLPSRARMLAIADAAARRGALIVTMREAALWTEAAGIAALPSRQHVTARTWRATYVDRLNLGDEGWSCVCRRIEEHLRRRTGPTR